MEGNSTFVEFGACEKYIPLSVMEGLEMWFQFENVMQALKYQFTRWPVVCMSGPN